MTQAVPVHVGLNGVDHRELALATALPSASVGAAVQEPEKHDA
jgi:hypothetical protein